MSVFSRFVLALLLAAVCAHGGLIVSTTGAVSVIPFPSLPTPDPPLIPIGALESNDHIFAWFAEQGVLTEPETAPQVIPGTFEGGSFVFPGSVTYPAGTLYAVVVIHHDPVGVSNTHLLGSITFSGPILYITDDVGSDDRFGGLDPGDSVTISSDLRTLSLELRAGPHVDQLFLAVQVPEPGAAGMFAAGLALLVFARRLGKAV